VTKKPASTSDFEGSTYAFADGLMSTVPEIRQLVTQALAEHWDPTRFAQAMQATGWWKLHSDTARQQIALQAQDPTTYKQNLTNATAHVIHVAAQMGVKLTPAQVNSMALTDMYQGRDDESLQYNLASLYSPGSQSNRTGGGTAGEYDLQIRAMAAEYGIPMSANTRNDLVANAIKTGSLSYAQAWVVNTAKSTYRGISDQIDVNTSVKQLASPYMDQMAQTLEIDPSTIKLTDPTIQRALQNPSADTTPPKNAKGKPQTPAAPAGPIPLYQFQDQLRADPRWQKTDNARQSAFSMLHSLGQTFGFAT
jgi:hypothetical protein